MRFSNLLLAVATVLLPLSPMAAEKVADAALSHCTTDEKTYFSCSTGKKLISICGSKILSAKSGYLQYRFGVSGNPELVLPPGRESPAKYFTYSNSAGTGTGTAALSVKSGQFRYDIYSEYVVRGPGDESQGVRVNRDGKEVANVRCKKTTVDELEKMSGIGLANPVLPVAATGSPLVIIKAVPQTTPDKDIKSKTPIEVTGKIEFGNDAAGGNFWINGGKKKQYTLGYVWDIDDATQAQLGTIADSGATVTVKGTLKVWKDGSAAFDNADPISIFK